MGGAWEALCESVSDRAAEPVGRTAPRCAVLRGISIIVVGRAGHGPGPGAGSTESRPGFCFSGVRVSAFLSVNTPTNQKPEKRTLGRKSTDEGGLGVLPTRRTGALAGSLFGVLGSHAETLVVVVLYRRYWFLCVLGTGAWLGMGPGWDGEVVFVFVLAVVATPNVIRGSSP